MTTLMKYSVGVDVSKDTLHACICEIDSQQQVKIKTSHRFLNSKKDYTALMQWFTKHRKQDVPLVICMEATGIYYEKVALELYQKGYSVSVLLPSKAKRYMQSLGLKTKNDKIDASGLAQMGAEQSLALWQPLGDYFYKLRQLTRHHEQLQQSRTVFLSQLHAIQHSMIEVKEVVKHQKKVLELIEKQLQETLKAIAGHIKANVDVNRKVKQICQIKGVGLLSAATVIAETNGFALFNSIGQLVSYAGYDVIENQSGNQHGKTRISKKGNSHIRRIMHMPAFVAIQHHQQPFKSLYNRVYDRTQIKMKGYVAVQKKLLALMYTLWKNDCAFDAEYKGKSGNDEPKPLFVLGSEGATAEQDEIKIVPIKTGTTQDELPYNESPEALFLLDQK